MMLRVLLLLIIVTSMTRCSKIDPCGPMPIGSGKAVAQSYTSDEGRFRIGLPMMAARPGPKARTGNEKDKTVSLNILNRGDFHVSYMDGDYDLEAPETSQAIINNLREQLRSKGNATLEVDSELKLGGHPGRELRFRGDHGLQIHRIYLVRNRMYSVSAFVPPKLECGVDDVIKTLDTFEIIE